MQDPREQFTQFYDRALSQFVLTSDPQFLQPILGEKGHTGCLNRNIHVDNGTQDVSNKSHLPEIDR